MKKEEREFCPLLSIGQAVLEPCRKDRCSLYIDDLEECTLKTIGLELRELVEMTREIAWRLNE